MVTSNQPRFSESSESPDQFFFSTMNAFDKLDSPEPPYSKDSRVRDKWLIDFVRREPHLAGVVASVTATDKNRGWKVIGGRNQVRRVTEMLHSFEVAPGLSGWRPAIAFCSQAFWNTDIGSIVELGKDSENGPVRALYTTDPTKCRLSGKSDKPLIYSPSNGSKQQYWRDSDFFRVVSLPSLYEEYRGLGNCAVSRCVQLAQIMIALFRHEEEKLFARAPRGLLLLSGIKQAQWDFAMKERSDKLDSDGMKYYGAVAVLASAASTVDAKLVALSQLPENFDFKIFMDMLMYGYSLCFGYDASEFWPVQYGSLGRGNEVQIQHEKATGKGRLDFVLGFQEQLQNFLPDSISFEFDQRDEQGDLLHASVHQAWAKVVTTLYESTSPSEGSLLSKEESRILLADYDLIPSGWVDVGNLHSTDLNDNDQDDSEIPEPPKDDADVQTNPVAASPTANVLIPANMDNPSRKLRTLKEQLLTNQSIWEAARKFPKDPIVQYSYPGNHEIILWEKAEDIFNPRIFPVK